MMLWIKSREQTQQPTGGHISETEMKGNKSLETGSIDRNGFTRRTIQWEYFTEPVEI
jgi:hypothetical protein